MAAALQYLKEHQLFEYDDLAAKTDAATEQFHTLAGDIQQTEAELSRVSDLMAAVVQYAKTRPAFDGYKAAKYNRKYLAEHEAELANYRAAKATMAELLGGEKLPKMDVLKEKRRQLAARKKALYLEYRKAQQDMRELVAVKGSVDHLRGLTDSQRNKEQACYGRRRRQYFFWSRWPEVQRVWGHPNKRFRSAEIASVNTLALLAVSALPQNWRK